MGALRLAAASIFVFTLILLPLMLVALPRAYGAEALPCLDRSVKSLETAGPNAVETGFLGEPGAQRVVGADDVGEGLFAEHRPELCGLGHGYFPDSPSGHHHSRIPPWNRRLPQANVAYCRAISNT